MSLFPNVYSDWDQVKPKPFSHMESRNPNIGAITHIRYGMEASQVVSLPTTQMSTQEIRFLPVALEVEVTDDVGVPGGNVVTGPEIYIRHSVALMCSAVVKVGTRNLHILLAQPETCCRPRG